MSRFFVRAFLARLKTAAAPSFIAAVIILSAGIIALGLIFNRETGSIGVGVYIMEADNGAYIAERTIRSMEYYSKNDFAIHRYTNEEQMKQDVSARKLDCAYTLTPFTGELMTEQAIISYRSPGSIANNIVDLIMAAAYLENFAGVLAYEALQPFITEMNITDSGDIASIIQNMADGYLIDGALMDIEFVEYGMPMTQGQASAPYRPLFHRLIGLFGLFSALLCAMGLSGDTDKTILNRLKSTGTNGWVYKLAGIAVVFIVSTVFNVTTTIAGNFLFPGLSPSAGLVFIYAISYALALSGIAVFLSTYVNNVFFPAITTFIIIFATLLGGVLFDIREIMPAAAFLRHMFPNYFYASGILGLGPALQNIIVLCATWAVGGILSLMSALFR